MKNYKLLIIAIGLVSAFFLPSYAQAQLNEIIVEFCEDTSDAVDDAVRELGRASEDLEECFEDYDDCLNGFLFGNDPADCLDRFFHCYKRGNREEARACRDFTREFKDAYEDARREARRDNVEDEFLNSQQVQDCLLSGLAAGKICAEVTEGE